MAVKTKKPKDKKPKVQPGAGLSREQRLRLRFGYGMDPISAWRRATPKQRATIRTRAKRQDTTVGGYIRGGARALRERSEGGIARQARRTISRAYAPEEQELKDQEEKVRNLDAKRATDEQYFNQWLADRQNQLEAQATQANAARQQGMLDEYAAVAQRFQGAQQTSEATVAGGPGVDLGAAGGQSTVLNTAPQAGAAALGVGASHERSRASQIASGAQRLAGAQAGVQFSQARRLKQTSQTAEALEDLRKDFKKLGLRRTGDIAKEITRLQDTEISKAERTREYTAAAQKLGIDVGELKLKQRGQREEERSNKAQERLDKLEQIRKEREFTAKEEREWAELNAKVRKDEREASGKEGAKAKENRKIWSKTVAEARRATQTGTPPTWTEAAKENPLLRRAAVWVAAGKGVPPQLARRIKQEYGITVPTAKKRKANTKRSPNTGSPGGRYGPT